MASAMSARTKGEDFQALIFWEKVCLMFLSGSNVSQVGYELDEIKSIDDIIVFYSKPRNDCRGNKISADYYQAKYHVSDNGSYTIDSLMDPKFIKGTTNSILNNLQNAIEKAGKKPAEIRAIYISTWGVDRYDNLAKVHSPDEGEIRLDVLFNPKYHKTIKKKFMQHLSLSTEDELRNVLMPLRIKQIVSVEEAWEHVNQSLVSNGFEPIDLSSKINRYISLLRKWVQEDRTIFTRDDIIQGCKDEGLYPAESHAPDTVTIGIRSFSVELKTKHQMHHCLDLCNYFEGRQLKAGFRWDKDIYPQIRDFVRANVDTDHLFELSLDTHTSIGYTLGSLLDTKTGVRIQLLQKASCGIDLWSLASVDEYSCDSLQFREIKTKSQGSEVAVSIGITRNIHDCVTTYVDKELPNVGKVIFCESARGFHDKTVINGLHAAAYSSDICSRLMQRTAAERRATLHVFIAAPISFSFILGRLSKSFGTHVLYEYDFDSTANGDYLRSLAFPHK